MVGRDGAEVVFEIWPENARAVEMFLACRTQWRLGPMDGVLGLDYQGLFALLRMKKVRDMDAMLGDIQAMEAAALPILNEPTP